MTLLMILQEAAITASELELVKVFAQIGGAPAVVGFVLWKFWHRVETKLDRMNDNFNKFDRRLTVLETSLKLRRRDDP